ncbi:type II secretion system F family protein [archaeon]|nr:type II secretion system F family protein [archaeon]
MTSNKLKVFKNLGTGDKVDFEFPFFMLYLRAVTSETLSRFILLNNAAEKSIFKYIGVFLRKILLLSEEWRYPQAKASELVSEEVPTEDYSSFLYKFAQSINSGETVNDFIEREYKSYIAEFQARRTQAIYRLKTLSDAYLPLMSVSLFLCTTMLISSLFYDAELMIFLTIAIVIVISVLLYIVSWMIYQNAKPESILIDEQKEKTKKRSRLEIISAITIFACGLSLLIPVNNFWHLGIIGALLLIPGTLGKRYVEKVKAIEADYPSFFRYLSSNLTAEIRLSDVLDRATETDFGSLNAPIRGLYNKLKMRVSPAISWWSFETEIDSKLIRRINLIMTDTLATGGDLGDSSKYIEDFFHIYTTIRKQRYSASSYHAGILLPIYFVMCVLFGIIYGFFDALEDIIIKMSTVVDLLEIPSLEFMELFFTFAIVMFALNNVFSLYNMEGDSRFTIAFYTGLQLSIGPTLYVVVSHLVAQSLGSIGAI